MASSGTASPPSDSTGEYATNGTASPRRVRVQIAGLTDPGKVRANNEDHFLIARLAKSMQVVGTSLSGDGATQFSDEEGYLMVVADGLGGASAGEHASALAVRSVEEFVLNTFKWFLHLGQKEEYELLRELRQVVERADRTVFERAQANPRLVGMGTTLSMAYSVAADLFVVHAGDSRAYLFRDGEIEQLTTDHTLVQAMVDGGLITPDAARQHKRRNVVTNVIGGPQQGVRAEIHKLAVQAGDVLLLCTDGLTEPVGDVEIARILGESSDPQSACAKLVEEALNRGGPDNVTAVVARYQFD